MNNGIFILRPVKFISENSPVRFFKLNMVNDLYMERAEYKPVSSELSFVSSSSSNKKEVFKSVVFLLEIC